MLRSVRRLLLTGMMLAGTVPAVAQEKKDVPPGTPVQVQVTTAAPAPDVSITLGKRIARVLPARTGCTHTGGGTIDVQQPTSDTLVVTMKGVAVAYGSPLGAAEAALDFSLSQGFEVSFDKPGVKAAKLTLDARATGFLRSHESGSAAAGGGAGVTGFGCAGATITLPGWSVSGGQSESINDAEEPVSVVLPAAGAYCLTQQFRVSSSMPKALFKCKAPSAEFDAALDPLWIAAKEPFKGAKKDAAGFVVTLKVVPTDPPAAPVKPAAAAVKR